MTQSLQTFNDFIETKNTKCASQSQPNSQSQPKSQTEVPQKVKNGEKGSFSL